MSKPETELVIYAKVTKPEGLELATKIIYQEQAQIKAQNGRIRVRMEKNKGEENYSYNILVKTGYKKEAVQTAMESAPIDIDGNLYEMFKQASGEFMRKVRYVFKVEKVTIASPGLTGELTVDDLFYEVDRFIKADGSFSEWVKIDVEIDSLLTALNAAGLNAELKKEMIVKVSSLPFGPESIFIDDGSKDNSMRKLVDKIYETEFIRKLT